MYRLCRDTYDTIYKFRLINKVKFNVSKNISSIINDPLFFRFKIGLKKSFITRIYTILTMMKICGEKLINWKL